MYGKVDPNARQPYRCVREKGLLPGCKSYHKLFVAKKKLIKLFCSNLNF